MLIAIDYDGTITLDPEYWLAFVELTKFRGHEVIIVTGRNAHDHVVHTLECRVFYTDGKGTKAEYMAKTFGIKPDVWIDNEPGMVEHSRVLQF